jgi:predicted nucleic acid-binding protein
METSMAPPKQPVWLDSNILINIARGRSPYAETYILELQKDGHEVLFPPHVEREFLLAPGADTVTAQRVITRLGAKVDTMVKLISPDV